MVGRREAAENYCSSIGQADRNDFVARRLAEYRSLPRSQTRGKAVSVKPRHRTAAALCARWALITDDPELGLGQCR